MFPAIFNLRKDVGRRLTRHEESVHDCLDTAFVAFF